MSTDSVSSLRQRMIEDMNARKLCAGTQRGHIRSCKQFAAFLKRSPDTATSEDIRRFQLHLAESGASICNRNRIMTGLRFLFRVTLRRLDLAAEIRLPAALPSIFGGLKVGISLAVIGAVIGEYVAAEHGLGYLQLQASSQLDTTLSFASLLIIAGMGVVTFWALEVVERHAVFQREVAK